VATLWFGFGGKNREVLLDQVKKFNESQRRFLIEPTFQGDYFETLAKVRTAIAAGAGPSFTHVVGEVVPYMYEAGALAPLDDLPGAADLDLVDALAQSGSYIGGAKRPLVAVPFYRSTPIMYANGTMLDEAGISAPKTWDELRAAAKALTRNEPSPRSGYQVPVGWWFWVALVWQAGGEIVAPDGRVTLGDDAGARAIKLWQSMVHDDHSMRPPPGRDYNAWQRTNEDFLAGRVAMICTSTAYMRYLEENAKFPVRAMALPGDKTTAVPTGGTFFVMLKNTPPEEREAAWAFLRFMYEAEQAKSWSSRTGYLPVTRGAITALENDGFYKTHPNDVVALKQLETARPWPWSSRLFRVQREAVEPRIEEAVLKNRDAVELLAEARRVAEEP
jgi:sn-glycerol 3-phosphate transport system substrate-binding protein